MNRDNFTKKTIEVLAKRVGYLCSNPQCRRHTIGPNSDPEKSTNIGVAAHIEAAAPLGPRYNQSQTEAVRRSIENAIWLCSDCSTLIDKNSADYPVSKLKLWKRDAEQEMNAKLASSASQTESTPFIEADLIWSNNGRKFKGYSSKNGPVIEAGDRTAIAFYDLDWNFTIKLYNNSNVVAYNIKVEYVGATKFTYISALPNVNNLQELDNVELKASYKEYMEGSSIDADQKLSHAIPQNLNGLQLRIKYYDKNRNVEYKTLMTITGQQITNIRE